MRVVMFICALFCAAPADAQLGYDWTPAELVAQSDLVVICEHVSTQPTGVRTQHPGLQPAALPVLEVVSTLRVLAVLKGSSEVQVRVRHYWLDREQHPGAVVNAGSELRFDPRRKTYLAFLDRDQIGLYAPTSGFTFPTTSVQRLVESGTDPAR